MLFGGYFKKELQVREEWEKTMREHDNKLREKEVLMAAESTERAAIQERLALGRALLESQERKEAEL